MARLLLALLITLGVLPACAASPPAAANPAAGATAFQPAQLRGFPRDTLAIDRRGGRDVLQVWLAVTPDQMQQGLMWIRELPRDHGMLFVLEEPRPMSMWMKNTYVSLDMLFIDARGRIVNIARRTQPLSEKIIESGAVVAAVLEIAAGEADRRGIAVGDRIDHATFAADR